jgi:cytochrome b561
MKYPLVMRFFHWTMATIIVGLAFAGLCMVSLPDKDPLKFPVFYPWHKSFGLLIFILVGLRLMARLRASIPGFPAGLSPIEVATAQFTHGTLYVLMVFVPFMGYAMSSTYTESGGDFLFGIPLPQFLPKNDNYSNAFMYCHRYSAYTLLGLAGFHVLGVLKHRYLDKNRANDVLSRMT